MKIVRSRADPFSIWLLLLCFGDLCIVRPALAGGPEFNSTTNDYDEDVAEAVQDFMVGFHRTLESRRIREKRSSGQYHTIASGGGNTLGFTDTITSGRFQSPLAFDFFFFIRLIAADHRRFVNFSLTRLTPSYSANFRFGQHQTEHQSECDRAAVSGLARSKCDATSAHVELVQHVRRHASVLEYTLSDCGR